jgi:hypothetical protein
MIFGTYAYRFSGHALKKKSQHFLVGVGTMTLDAGLKIRTTSRVAPGCDQLWRTNERFQP